MENSTERKLCISRESICFDLTIYLYGCYDEHESPRSCNSTVYLSWLIQSDDVLGGTFHKRKLTNCEHKKLWLSQY